MEASSHTEENVVDPFANDIFAAKQKPGEENAHAPSPPPAPNWSRALKKRPPSRIGWNELLDDLPADFPARLPTHLTEALQNLLALAPENRIELLPLMTREINGAEDFPVDANRSWWLSVAVEQSASEIWIELDNAFAGWLVEAALGEQISEQTGWRELTGTEAAVLEYLSLNLVYQSNRALGAPVFKIRSLRRDPPARLAETQKNFREEDAMLLFGWQTIHALLPSIVRIYVTPEALKSLSATENSLLAAAPRRADEKRFEDHLRDAGARLSLGRVDLTASELASLEAGDIALLENHHLNLFGGNLFGRVEIFIGDGEGLRMAGEILAPEAAPSEAFEENAAEVDNKILVKNFSANQTWKFVVTDLAQIEKPRALELIMTETDENAGGETGLETSDGGNGLAVENLPLTLRVELEARRLTLAEIAGLRENQILELGVRATDPVNLLIEDRVVGRGELVEVEERLGVRITKLLR